MPYLEPGSIAKAFVDDCDYTKTVTNAYSVTDSPYKRDTVRTVADGVREELRQQFAYGPKSFS